MIGAAKGYEIPVKLSTSLLDPAIMEKAILTAVEN